MLVSLGGKVFVQEQTKRTPMLLRDGVLKSLVYTVDGDEVILRVHFKGDIVGLPTETCEVRAVIDAWLEPCELNGQYRGLLERRLKETEAHVVRRATMNSVDLIIDALLDIHARGGAHIVPLTQMELAQYCGTRFETVNRVFKYMAVQGAIEVVNATAWGRCAGRRMAKVVDPAKLRTFMGRLSVHGGSDRSTIVGLRARCEDVPVAAD